MEHRQVDLRNNSLMSKACDALKSSPKEDPQFHSSPEENSENNDWCSIVCDDRSDKKSPLSELDIPSPEYFSAYSDER